MGGGAACLAVTAAVVYAGALGTARGRRLDEHAMLDGWRGAATSRPQASAVAFVEAVNGTTFALLVFGLVCVSLGGRRRRLAAVVGVAMVASAATSSILKPVLGAVDPLGGEEHRLLESVFPSGHATAAMAFALALPLVVAADSRYWATVLGTGYAAAMGALLVALSNHYPSDVLAGFCVAGAWHALALGAAVPSEGRVLIRADARGFAAATAGAGIAVLLVLLLVRREGMLVDAHAHAAFLTSVIAIAAGAVALGGASTSLLSSGAGQPLAPRG